MQTVDIQCGQCGKIMAVGQEFLGQQVRCPHCQQVVLAPAPPSPPTPVENVAPAPPEFTFAVPPPTERESIFDVTVETGDDLFGEGAAPQIEMPPPAVTEPAPTPVAAESPAPEPALPFGPTFGVTDTTPVQAFEPAAMDAGGWPAATPSGTSLTSEPFAATMARPAAAPTRSHGWFLAIVVVPLITYSVLATILVVILYSRLHAPQKSPLEELPDLEGEFKGAARQKQGTLSYERVAPEQELPPRLRVALGQTLRVGDLEVTPQRVELRPVVFRAPGSDAEKARDDSLVLHLRLRNVSSDVVYSPTDPFFDRRWKKGQAWGNRPYTYLEIGARRVYGGALPWTPSRPVAVRETVEGQAHRRLQPGETLDTFVCTDPDDHVAKLLAGHRGGCLWRVQLRRGLVAVRGRDLPATAVVGCEFAAADVTRAAPE